MTKHMKLKPMSMGLLAMIQLVSSSRIYEGHWWLTDVPAHCPFGTAYFIELRARYRQIKARERGAEW